MDEFKVLKTTDEIKAFSDPYRLEILNRFYKFKEPATVKQVADDMGEVPAKVYYHVKKMEECGIVRLVYTREINGIIAKYYEPAAKKFDIRKFNIAEPLQKVMLNETQSMMASIYNDSLKDMLQSISDNKGYKMNAAITKDNLYLTDDELKAFCKMIDDFCENHNSRKTDDGNIHEYHFFLTTIRK